MDGCIQTSIPQPSRHGHGPYFSRDLGWFWMVKRVVPCKKIADLVWRSWRQKLFDYDDYATG